MWNQGKIHSKMKNLSLSIFGLSISSFMIQAFMSEVIPKFELNLTIFELLSGCFPLIPIVAEEKTHFAPFRQK